MVGLPTRLPLLAEALASVGAQTRPPDDLVVGVDWSWRGEVWNQNRLLVAVDCDWLAFLHDDDIWHPNHLEVAEAHFQADVVVSRFDMAGRPWDSIEPWHDDFEDLRFTNWIGSPSGVLVRASTFGRWVSPGDHGTPWVDLTNYRRLLASGATFADTRTVTWTYRFHGDNGSWRP